MLGRSHPALISLSCGSDKLRRHADRKVLGDTPVTRKRLRWVAIQTVVVTALAVVVALTLLKPESNSPLSPVNGTGNAPNVAQGPGGGGPGGPNGGGHGSGHGNGGGGDRGQGHRGRGHGGSAAPTGVATASVGGSPALSPAAPESSATRPGESPGSGAPTVDQYEDTLSRIDAALD